MTVKIQYNPSTGKASYNPATGKVQVLNIGGPAPTPCEHCSGTTPRFLRATFSGITIPSVDSCCDAGSTGRKVTQIIDPNGAYILEEIFVTVGCTWRFQSVGDPNYATVERRNSSDCSGSIIETLNHDKIDVFVRKVNADDFIIQLRYDYSGSSPLRNMLFDFQGEPEIDSGCLNLTDIPNDQTSILCSNPSTPSFEHMGSGGTVTVEEIQ